MVAWKDTKELRRTIVDAMPLLTSAEDVVVLAMEESHGVDEKALADTVRFLTRHSVRAKSIVEPRQTGDIWMAVIDIAHRLKADLIVAGAYGHSRFREWIFGGVTRTLLQNNLINGFCLRVEVGSVSPPREFQSLRSIKDVA
ncbi:universal stress protein [Rhizobium leguminosarum]|uniref:universal stress protein n=1 Tax=Rhizobium leguminosarum TaxID=384 RepID=UPI0028F45990|nr:universal stress protein [Rhizobium leguminosarum]